MTTDCLRWAFEAQKAVGSTRAYSGPERGEARVEKGRGVSVRGMNGRGVRVTAVTDRR
jgi:hypothetical protein